MSNLGRALKRLKQPILKTLGGLGYEVRKIRSDPNVGLYVSLYSGPSIHERRFYNIGAGGFSHPCWTNVDMVSDWYARNRRQTLKGIQFDMLSLLPLPMETASAEAVYSSHTVEHVNDEAAQNMFNEVHRVLKPGGYFRVTAPNVNQGFEAWRRNDRRFFYWSDTYSIPEKWRAIQLNGPMNDASIAQLFLYQFASSVSVLHADGAERRIEDAELDRLFRTMSREDALNFICAQCPLEIQRRYPGNHINWWSPDKILAMLGKAGFSVAYPSAYGQSICPAMRDTAYFDNTHPAISFYFEALAEREDGR